jgi:tellurite resistance protein TerC
MTKLAQVLPMSEWLSIGLFTLLVLGMLALDLGVIHRRPHAVSTRAAAAWSAVWIGLAIAFGIGIFLWRGPESGIQFFAGYLLEKALSLDNIFLFTVILGSLGVPPLHRHKLLFWGVVGALVMRGLFIAAGAALISRFHWVLYIFGAFLIMTGVRLLRHGRKAPDPERNPLVRRVQSVFPLAAESGGAFLLRRDGRWFATPLLLALIMVEAADLVLALDSIPAVFAVTRDPFIVFSSNVLAILGLRSLYFVLAGVMKKLRYLHVGLAAILIFVGCKMLVGSFLEVPLAVSLAVICAVLLLTILASLRAAPENGAPAAGGDGGKPVDGSKAEDPQSESTEKLKVQPGPPVPLPARCGHAHYPGGC